MSAFAAHPTKKCPATKKFSIRHSARVFQIPLEVVARDSRFALGVQHVRDIANGHRCNQYDLLSGTRYGDVQTSLAPLLAEHPEETLERPLAIAAERGRKDDDVALIALDVFYVLDENAHVFAAVAAITFFAIRVAEFFVLFGT